MKGALSAGSPLVVACTLPVSIRHLDGNAAHLPYTKPDGPADAADAGGADAGAKGEGRHAMVLVGYDDNHRAYRILNSWGPGWGDGGYFWWDYDDLEKRGACEVYVPIELPEHLSLAQPVEVFGAVAYENVNRKPSIVVRIRGRRADDDQEGDPARRQGRVPQDLPGSGLVGEVRRHLLLEREHQGARRRPGDARHRGRHAEQRKDRALDGAAGDDPRVDRAKKD